MALDKGYPQGDYSFVTDVQSFFDDFEKTVSTVKRCKNSNECIRNTYYLHGAPDVPAGNGNAVITNDGMVYTFAIYYAGALGISEDDRDNYIGRFWVDVNGQKGPQTYGKDLFAFVLIQGKGILPAGYGSTSDCHKNGQGCSCTARVLRDNAINYY